MENLSPITNPIHYHVLLLKRLINKKSTLKPFANLTTFTETSFNFNWVTECEYNKEAVTVVKEIQAANIKPPSSHLGWVGPRTWKWLGVSVDINYRCDLVTQDDNYHCWEATSIMILSGAGTKIIKPKTSQIDFFPNGSIKNTPLNYIKFAEINNFKSVRLSSKPSATQIIHYLQISKSPIILCYWSPATAGQSGADSHWVVCSGAVGDGYNDGTMLKILDPAPVGVGDETPWFYDNWLSDKDVYFLFYKL